MKTNFFSKLAWRNIQSNSQLYLPYILSSILTVSMFHIMMNLTSNQFVRERTALLSNLIGTGAVVVGIFALIFLFYINSFLIRRRKKEIGLYSVLGLEKRHVAWIMTIETLITGGFSILGGVGVGLLFGQLSFMFLNYLLNFPEAIAYAVSWQAVGITAALFGAIYLLTMIYNIAQVTLADPIGLLKGGKEGEKEPKSSPILFLLGLAALGGGYYISLSISDLMNALSLFLVAVILVIIGTYLLFTAGSIIVLKWLKKKESFYYKPGPFISVSGMLYRMKQHAVGLANISILSVMVIIAVSTTITLFAGAEDTLSNRYPEENNLSIMTDDDMSADALGSLLEELDQDIDEWSAEQGYTVDQSSYYRYISISGAMENNSLVLRSFDDRSGNPMMIEVLPLEDFNQLAGSALTMGDDELLLYPMGPDISEEEFYMMDRAFDVTLIDDLPESIDTSYANLVDTLFIIAPNDQVITEMSESYNEMVAYPVSYSASFFWSTLEEEEGDDNYAAVVYDFLRDHEYDAGLFYDSREANREEWYSMNGGFLFIGIFLGGLFMIGAVLITYYKQVSEGFDDRERIQIMQKVGLDKETTRKATRSQILWMFTLPILTAVLHTAVAFPLIAQLMSVFSITNNTLFLTTVIGVVSVYAILYFVIYQVTSRVYLKIVE
jgi:putative ABC transport system permease protein